MNAVAVGPGGRNLVVKSCVNRVVVARSGAGGGAGYENYVSGAVDKRRGLNILAGLRFFGDDRRDRREACLRRVGASAVF